MKQAIEKTLEFLDEVIINNRETEDKTSLTSIAYSNGLEDGIEWAIENLVTYEHEVALNETSNF